MKKVCSVNWKSVIGQSASGKAAWRWARTCAAGRCGVSAGNLAGNWGGGQRAESAVRILLWPRPKRFQMRCKVRSLRWQPAARIAARMQPAAASWRNRHRQPVVRLSRRILSAHQTLKVRPQPRPSIAVAAKDPACANGFARGEALVKAAQIAVANERAARLAMRTGRLLESLGKRDPILVVAAKPLHVAHADQAFPKRVILQMWGRGGVEAGYDVHP